MPFQTIITSHEDADSQGRIETTVTELSIEQELAILNRLKPEQTRLRFTGARRPTGQPLLFDLSTWDSAIEFIQRSEKIAEKHKYRWSVPTPDKLIFGPEGRPSPNLIPSHLQVTQAASIDSCLAAGTIKIKKGQITIGHKSGDYCPPFSALYHFLTTFWKLGGEKILGSADYFILRERDEFNRITLKHPIRLSTFKRWVTQELDRLGALEKEKHSQAIPCNPSTPLGVAAPYPSTPVGVAAPYPSTPERVAAPYPSTPEGVAAPYPSTPVDQISAAYPSAPVGQSTPLEQISVPRAPLSPIPVNPHPNRIENQTFTPKARVEVLRAEPTSPPKVMPLNYFDPSYTPVHKASSDIPSTVKAHSDTRLDLSFSSPLFFGDLEVTTQITTSGTDASQSDSATPPQSPLRRTPHARFTRLETSANVPSSPREPSFLSKRSLFAQSARRSVPREIDRENQNPNDRIIRQPVTPVKRTGEPLTPESVKKARSELAQSFSFR